MTSTFAFCLQLPENELKPAFMMMHNWLQHQKHGSSHISANQFEETICEIKVRCSKKLLSKFKTWFSEFPSVDNAISHYIVENPRRKEYEPIAITATEPAEA